MIKILLVLGAARYKRSKDLKSTTVVVVLAITTESGMTPQEAAAGATAPDVKVPSDVKSTCSSLVANTNVRVARAFEIGLRCEEEQ